MTDEVKKEQAAAPESAAAPAKEEPAKKAPVVKKEKPDKCEQCNKALSRVKWYYRNNGYFCTTRCWKEFRAKQQEAAHKAAAAAAPKA
jgi:hypothetical protein